MTTVTVFRHAPPPVVGVCGVMPDPAFERFEQTLDWLEAAGVLVERFDPYQEPAEAARCEVAMETIAKQGSHCLPLILVDGVIVSSGHHPNRTQLARLVGQHRMDLVVAR